MGVCGTGIQSEVLSLDYSYTGELLATSTLDGHVVVWDMATGTLKYLLRHPVPPADEEEVSAESYKKAARKQKKAAKEGKRRKSAVPGGRDTLCLSSVAGSHTCARNSTVTLADPVELAAAEYKRKVREGRVPKPPPATMVRFLPNSRSGYSALYRVLPAIVSPLVHRTLLPNSRFLVSGDDKGRLYQWNIRTGQYREMRPKPGAVVEEYDDMESLASSKAGSATSGQVETKDEDFGPAEDGSVGIYTGAATATAAATALVNVTACAYTLFSPHREFTGWRLIGG